MTNDLFRFTFVPDVPIDEVERTLVLSLLVVQILHGDAQSRLGLGHYFDRKRRVCIVDASTPQGHDLSKLLAGLFAREYGPDAFVVRPARRRPQQLAAHRALNREGSRT
jgi:hypothetical protein